MAGDEIQDDIARMGIALEALSAIPTAERRRIAFDWLTARVTADIAKLRHEEHIERVADAVGVFFGEQPAASTDRGTP